MEKLLIMGLGQVGTSFLNLILKEKEFDISNIFILDKDKSVFSKFVDFGGNINNCIEMFIESSNYLELFNYINENDYILDLVNGVDNLILSTECLKRNIHYISTCDDCFDNKFNCFTFQSHFDEYKKLLLNSSGKATCIAEFGMNPGMVNVFTKKALIDIVEYDLGSYVSKNRKFLKSLIVYNKFDYLAMVLGVRGFIETDVDITDTSIKEDDKTIYSTWNVPDYDIEIHERSIIKHGTINSLSELLNSLNKTSNDVFYYNKLNGTLILKDISLDIPIRTFSNIGKFNGYIVSHEENFSIYDYYSIRDIDGNIIYAPDIYFVYKPCDLSLDSVKKHLENENVQLILKKDMISGGEAVGMVVYGDNFSPRYVGNYLDMKDTFFETPTILQVSIGCLSAIKYIKNHPNEGFLFPENTDCEEIISYALPYMKKIDSINLFQILKDVSI